MSADHLLHVKMQDDYVQFSLTCIADVGEHYTLWESDCTCQCDMCRGDDEFEPDHWGCDNPPHDHSLDGAAPCQSRLDLDHCYALDVPISECLFGEFPEDGAPWPVSVDYFGDGEVRITYAPPSESPASDQEVQP